MSSIFTLPVTDLFYFIPNWAAFAASTKQVTTSLIYLSEMNSSLTPALTEEFHRMTEGQPFPATDFCRLCLECEGMTLRRLMDCKPQKSYKTTLNSPLQLSPSWMYVLEVLSEKVEGK